MRTHARRCLIALASLASGCGAPHAKAPAARPRIAIIASEKGPLGTRLVVLDEAGDRQFDLLEAAENTTRDSHPAISPDGNWIVFVSSRDRAIDQTSLWIAPLAAGASPVRLTDGAGIEAHPVWTPDGTSVVFASTRDGGDFDLYAERVDHGRGVGTPTALTSAPGHEITPAVARDGTIYYAAITPHDDASIESHLEARAADGSIARITEGPADASPALSPDGRTLAFSRPRPHAAGLDGELWTMPVGNAAAAAPLIDLPLTDESGPVWSPDGAYLFATSVLRGAEGNPIFSSVIVIDLRARTRSARVLTDRAGAIARLTPAITRTPLDRAALAGDPEYLPELRRIMAGAIARHNLDESAQSP